jgi:hypothetical protein
MIAAVTSSEVETSTRPPEVQHIERRIVAMSELLDPDQRESPLAAFVGGSWHRSTQKPVSALRTLLARFPSVVAVGTPVGMPDTFLGWIAVAPSRNAIIHCYVKPLFRAPSDGHPPSPPDDGNEQFRVGSSLAILCGVDFGQPVECLTWSKFAQKIAARPGNPYRLVRAR